jgi:glycosyltransferase involved in cell wall biosynthesis
VNNENPHGTPDYYPAVGVPSCSSSKRQDGLRGADTMSPIKASIIDGLDMFAMPSVAESFGMVYVETWMCRKPVIGAGIPSTACVIEGGLDGLLVPPESPDDLARALLALLSDDQARARIGQAGYDKTIKSFTWNHIVDRFEEVYRGAMRHAADESRPVPAASTAA